MHAQFDSTAHHCEQVLILHYESHTSPFKLLYDSEVGRGNVSLVGKELEVRPELLTIFQRR